MHTSKIVLFNTTEECINPFAIGYIINPTLHVNKVFRYQVENFLKETFHQSNMTAMKNVMRKKDTCVIALVMFYDTFKNPRKVYRVLSCLLYSFMENYFCIDYICCHSKTSSIISSDKISEEASYNELLGIGILEVLINHISCHGFTKNVNSTVILVCQSHLVNFHLSKGLVILEHNSKQLISDPNDTKLRTHEIN